VQTACDGVMRPEELEVYLAWVESGPENGISSSEYTQIVTESCEEYFEQQSAECIACETEIVDSVYGNGDG
jgi:hypothetical protein